jgi:hypothetical protein
MRSDAVAEGPTSESVETRIRPVRNARPHNPRSEVELFEHTIHWGVHPMVRVTVNKLSATNKFDAGIKLELKAAKIVIERARITRFLAGTLKSTIEFKYKEFPLGTPVERTIDLPGQFVAARRDQPERDHGRPSPARHGQDPQAVIRLNVTM